MTGQAPSPTRAWQMALDTLRMEMPKASFDTWVRDAKLIAYNDGTFTIGVANAYAREWLDSRLTSMVNRFLTGVIKRRATVQFVVWEDDDSEELRGRQGDTFQDEEGEKDPHKEILNLQAKYKSIYDEFVQPDRVIVFPGYFLRYISLGVI